MQDYISRIAICLAFVFASVSFVWAQSAIETVRVNVNGSFLTEEGLVRDGVAYVPLHKVLGTMGVTYKWDPAKRRLIVNNRVVTGKVIRYKGVVYASSLSIANNARVKVSYTPAEGVVYLGAPKTAVASVPRTSQPPPQPSAPARTTIPAVSSTISEPFVPVLGENDVFKITVTNLENVASIKGQNVADAANKFVVVYLSQQNVSNEVQIYTGKFAMLDTNRRVYEYSEGLSNFWLMVLRPGGANFGYIVFEVPKDAQPMQLVLTTTTRPPLALDLK